MLDHHGYIEPPVFFSKAIDATPRDGTDVFLRRLQNPFHVARLVVFDTWIRNNDRYVEGAGANSDNLLYARAPEKGRYELVPIDHSHCITNQEFHVDLPAPNLIADDQVYGLYPEFIPFVTADAVDAALADLSQLDRPFVTECVNAIPPEWLLPTDVKEPLVDLICGRAAFVVGALRKKLVDAPLPFPGSGQ